MSTTSTTTVRQQLVDEFLAGHRIAVVGASEAPGNFAHTVYRELAAHGYEPVAVHPTATSIDGAVVHPDVASVPGDLDGVIVMVSAEHAEDVVRQCIARGVDRIWLFQGLGGTGAVSDAAVRTCTDAGVRLVPGACPLMFLEPVGWAHRLHRAARRSRGHLDVTSEPA